MSQIMFLSSLLLLVFASAFVNAQLSETFDVATYSPPSGFTKRAEGDKVTYTFSNPQGGFCILVIYKSANGTGNIETDFDKEWQNLLAKPFGITSRPTKQAGPSVSSWQNRTGGANFNFQGNAAAAILSTFSKGDRVFSYIVLLNDPALIDLLEAFTASLQIAEPPATSGNQPINTGKSPSLFQTWYTSRVISNNITHSYIKQQYEFLPNGTYNFYKKTFDIGWTFMLLARESGRYMINGDVLTLIPTSSVTEKWSKLDGADKWGQLLESTPRKLEKTSYRFTMHYFDGIGEWNLVLKPEQATARDGQFSSNSDFPGSYLYSIPPSSEHLIDLPRRR